MPDPIPVRRRKPDPNAVKKTKAVKKFLDSLDKTAGRVEDVLVAPIKGAKKAENIAGDVVTGLKKAKKTFVGKVKKLI